MYLQGDLQSMFDALFHLGIIDPVLEMDWEQAMKDMSGEPDQLFHIMKVANQHQGNVDSLLNELSGFDDISLKYLAMEVAREYADFHSRDELH